VPLKILIGLIICNIIWAINPSVGKVILRDFTGLQTAWLRTVGACLAYFLIAPLMKHRFGAAFAIPKVGSTSFWQLVALGFLTFCFSPWIAYQGLPKTQAVDNALLIAIEPLITLFMGYLFLKEKIARRTLFCFAGAFVGFCFLSGLQVSSQAFIGNLLIAAALFGEGSFSIFATKLLKHFPAQAFFGTALTFGSIFMTIVLVLGGGLEQGILVESGRFTTASILGVLWLGPIGSAVTYLYWTFALVHVPVSLLAITLFFQPLLGTLFGVVFLDEHLGAGQWVGGAILMSSVAYLVVPDIFKKSQ
jgi:drug/metabolite transporter (DMT)-like permease